MTRIEYWMTVEAEALRWGLSNAEANQRADAECEHYDRKPANERPWVEDDE